MIVTRMSAVAELLNSAKFNVVQMQYLYLYTDLSIIFIVDMFCSNVLSVQTESSIFVKQL
jgi:hypothetical protein